MNDSRISFSEERLRQLFAEFKLELLTEFAKKADQVAHDLLATRVTHLELWQAAQVATEGTKDKISARQVAVAALLIALIAAAATLYAAFH